jgi:hypothetical protein
VDCQKGDNVRCAVALTFVGVFDGWNSEKAGAKGFVLREHGAIHTLVCRLRLENQFYS